MIYYGIVDEIKEEHKPGIYGRRALTEKEAGKFSLSDGIELGLNIISVVSPMYDFLLVKPIRKLLMNTNKISFQNAISGETKTLIIDNDILDNNYKLKENHSLFYGLFDEFASKDAAFQTIMKSKGGAKLIIIERDKLPKDIEHFGGKYGKFSTGLYCSHPKKTKQLLPLKNSSNLVKTLILEETLRAYEALGAKKITIEDITSLEASASASKEMVDAKTTFQKGKSIIRKKEFGKGVFDAERALKDNLFIHDFPSIMTVVQGRINGNQLVEEFSEDIDLSAGLDINVLELFKANVGFNYNRKWHFYIEFYDKNESA